MGEGPVSLLTSNLEDALKCTHVPCCTRQIIIVKKHSRVDISILVVLGQRVSLSWVDIGSIHNNTTIM